MFRTDLTKYKYVVVVGPSQKEYAKPGLENMRIGFARTLESAIKKAENPAKLWRYNMVVPSFGSKGEGPKRNKELATLKHYDIYGVFEIVERYEPYWMNKKKGLALKALAGKKYPEPNGVKKP